MFCFCNKLIQIQNGALSTLWFFLQIREEEKYNKSDLKQEDLDIILTIILNLTIQWQWVAWSILAYSMMLRSEERRLQEYTIHLSNHTWSFSLLKYALFTLIGSASLFSILFGPKKELTRIFILTTFIINKVIKEEYISFVSNLLVGGNSV